MKTRFETTLRTPNDGRPHPGWWAMRCPTAQATHSPAPFARAAHVDWTSRDYFSLSRHAAVVDSFTAAALRHGAGAGGTRNISGTNHAIIQLEERTAALHNTPAALLFTSGYIANEATISTLAVLLPEAHFIVDEGCDTDIREGFQRTRVASETYSHCDVDALAQRLEDTGDRQAVIVTETLFRTSGRQAPLQAIVALAEKHGALLYAEESAALGLFGPAGAGLTAEHGLQEACAIIAGSFDTVLGGAGGYIAASEPIVDAIRSYAPSFIFTTAIPPACASAAVAAIDTMADDTALRAGHADTFKRVADVLSATGRSVPRYPVLYLTCVGETEALELTRRLAMAGHAAGMPIAASQAGLADAPAGTHVLPLSVTAARTDDEAEALCSAILAGTSAIGIVR